jgi:hypothetical protein
MRTIEVPVPKHKFKSHNVETVETQERGQLKK